MIAISVMGAQTHGTTRRGPEDREDGSVREALSQMNPNARFPDRRLSWDGRNGTERAFSGLAVQEAQARRCDTRNVPSAVRRRRYGGAVWEAGHPNGGLGKVGVTMATVNVDLERIKG